MLLRLFFGISILFIFISCSKDEPVYKINQKSNPYTLYKEAYDDFKVNDYFSASKKFSEAEINFKNINQKDEQNYNKRAQHALVLTCCSTTT